MLLLLNVALAGKVFEDLTLVNRAPAAPGEVLLFHTGDTSPKRVLLRSDEGDTTRARKVGALAYSYQLYRVPRLEPGAYGIVYIDAWGDERNAGGVEVAAEASAQAPTLIEVTTTKEDYVYDDGEGGYFPGRHAVARIEATPTTGTWFVEAANRSEPDRVPSRRALRADGKTELVVSNEGAWRRTHADEPWTVCPTIVIRDGRWKEVLRSEQPCLK